MDQPPYHLSIRPDTRLVSDEEGSWVVNDRMRMFIGQLTPGLSRAMEGLFNGGGTQGELGVLATDEDGFQSLPALYLLESRLSGAGVLCRSFYHKQHKQVTLVSLGVVDPVPDLSLELDQLLQLSRFTCIRLDGKELVAETPTTRSKIVLHDPQAITALQAWTEPANVIAMCRLTGLSAEYLSLLGGLVKHAGIVVSPDDQESSDANEALRLWEFHDLYFHTRSRVGRHNNPYGGTYPYAAEGEVAPLPALKPVPPAGSRIALPVPDMDALKTNDDSFARVVERRRSIRAHHPTKIITTDQLGEFLYRTCRILQVVPAQPAEICSKPYPGGGSVYELEVYPVVDRCDGLDTGLYHYRGESHSLTPIAGETPAVRRLLDLAWETIAKACKPQVLLVVTARFGRVSWKYQSVAYALVLKHVGVLYQNFYLAATAMGLAPCALGGGDSDLFSQASGLDYLAESAVGEFILGTPAEE